MAPVLLEDKQIPRRTLGHDMESFFAVIIWIATLNYDDDTAFQAKPLASMMLDRGKTPKDTANGKGRWFENPENFRTRIVSHFEPAYRKDMGFIKCLVELRRNLYSIPVLSGDLELNAYMDGGLDQNDNKVTEDNDPMKEGLFQKCMKEIDDYLNDAKGCSEMKWIDSQARTRHTPESLMQEGNQVD
jgi:hypothetical protein